MYTYLIYILVELFMKQQVIFFNWGNPRENYIDYYDYIKKIEYNPYAETFLSYSKNLSKNLGDQYEYILFPMPDKEFAEYRVWEIFFEKLIPYIKDNCIIVSTSLWSTAILKYLQVHTLNINISKIFFLAAAVEDCDKEILGSFQLENNDFSNINKQCKDIYLYHSKDDQSVPFSQFDIMKNYFPDAKTRIFENKGHFYKEERLIELEEDIKS